MEDALGKSTVRMLKLGLVAFAAMHWAACAFYYAASWNNFDSDTWVYHASLVPVLSPDGQVLVGYDASNAKKYLYSLYWAVVTMVRMADVYAAIPYSNASLLSVFASRGQ